MSLRNGFLPICLLSCVLSGPAAAQYLDPWTENPFVSRQRPLDARLAELKQALRLSGEQEKLFAVLEDQFHKAAQEREAAIVAAAIDRNRDERGDPGAFLRARADRLSRYADNLRALADAQTSFYSSLSDEQRKIAELSFPRDVLGPRDALRRRGRRPGGNG